MLSVVGQRIAASCAVAPTAQGMTAVAQAVGVMGLCSGGAACLGWTDRFVQWDPQQQQQEPLPPAILSVAKTFLRSLIMPGLLEELLWRVALQPPGMPVYQMVLVNAAFTAYHVFGSAVLAERFGGPHKWGARAVFTDPAFLALAFCLGNVCSYAHVRAGHAMWAPVLVHALPVTVWLSLLGGERALSTPGGLTDTNTTTTTTGIIQQGKDP